MTPTDPGLAVIVYRRPGCPFCLLLTLRLRIARIRFRSVNIWRDPASATFVRAHNDGNEVVPTVQIGSAVLSNPSLNHVRQALLR